MLPPALQALKDQALAARRAAIEAEAKRLKAQADENATQAAMNQDMLREAMEAELEPEIQRAFEMDLSAIGKDQTEYRPSYKLAGHHPIEARFLRVQTKQDDMVKTYWARAPIAGCQKGLIWKVGTPDYRVCATLGEALLAAEEEGPASEDGLGDELPF